METCGDLLTPRPRLDGPIDADVAILGAGYTGLWTAYYLLERDPSLRVAIIERRIAGFGAWHCPQYANLWLGVRYVQRAMARLDEIGEKTGRGSTGRTLAKRLSGH